LKAPNRISKLDQCALTGWLLESAKAHAKLVQCAFTRWLLESAKAHFETGLMRFNQMVTWDWIDAKKPDTKISNRNASFLGDGCLRAPKRFSKLDQCAFTG
jgi:hypothetical protein